MSVCLYPVTASSCSYYHSVSVLTGMIMDWRQMAGRPTSTSSDPWATLNSVWSGGKQVGVDDIETHWLTRIDPRRGWIIAVCWIAASCAEYVHRPSPKTCFNGEILQHLLSV